MTPQSLIPSKSGYTMIIGSPSPAPIDAISHPTSQLSTLRSASTRFSDFNTGLFTKSVSGKDCGVLYIGGDSKELLLMQENLSGDMVTLDSTTRVDNYTNRQFRASSVRLAQFENLLFMLNIDNNYIYKYDISGLTQHDNSFFDPATNANGKLLLDIFGGTGDVTEDAKHNQLKAMTVDPNGNLYLVDTDSSTVIVKVFDVNANHIISVNITEHLDGETPVDIAYTNDRFYLLTDTSVHELSTAVEHLKKWTLADDLANGEVYRCITPSKENENVVYIGTNFNVFKKFTSKLDSGIGSFIMTGRGMGTVNLQDIKFVSTVDHGDVEHVFVGDSSTNVVYRFIESSDYQRMLNQSFESRFLPVQNILIKEDEFVSNIVYNKTMAKMFYNHSLVAHSIVSKLISEYAGGKVRKFKTLQYILQEYVQSRSLGTIPKLGNFVGINEMHLSAVINRTLEKIYNFQILLMTDMQTHVIDTPSYVDKLPDTAVPVDNITPEDKYAYIDGNWVKESTLEE